LAVLSLPEQGTRTATMRTLKTQVVLPKSSTNE